MLPALRIIPISGVSLAILFLVLALNPSGTLRPPLPPAMLPVGSSLIAGEFHPQQRQFLFLAALRRADEVRKLLQLPDLPVRSHDAKLTHAAKSANEAKRAHEAGPSPRAERIYVPPAVEVAAIPADRRSDGMDASGTIAAASSAFIPVQVAAVPADRRSDQEDVTSAIAPISDASVPVEVAAIPADRRSNREDVTGTIASSDASIPIGIGESSSIELPVIPQQEQPPAIMMPARRNTLSESLNVAPVLPRPRPVITTQHRTRKRERRVRQIRQVHQVRRVQTAAKSTELNLFEPQDAVFKRESPAQY